MDIRSDLIRALMTVRKEMKQNKNAKLEAVYSEIALNLEFMIDGQAINESTVTVDE